MMNATLPAADWSAWAPANHAGLRWEGRLRFEDDGTAVFDWTQVRAHARFSGPCLALYADTAENYLDVMVDGKLRAVLGPKPKRQDAPLLRHWLPALPGGGVFVLDGLGPGTHRLLLAKRTGPNIGVVRLRGLRLAAGERLLSPPKAQGRRIEFLGDSLTNGYGDEGPGLQCADLPSYENSSVGWARLSASALGAEAQLLAYSGYGVVRNYGDKARQSPDPFPFYYPRRVLTEKAPWDRDQFRPQVAVVFLGTNDFSTAPAPLPADFIAAYRALLLTAREGRGALPILCLYPDEKTDLARCVKDLVAQEKAEGLPTQSLGLPGAKEGELGCDYHPLAVVHARWAKLVVPKLKKMMKWTGK
jgi:lysophospholipase L1-like esterase